MNLVSTKRKYNPTDIDAPVAPGGDAYSYGTRVCLDDEMLEKLGFPAPPPIGMTFTLMANVTVVAGRAEVGSEEASADLQITEMQLTPSSTPELAAMLWPATT